jgi:hypothetical protein
MKIKISLVILIIMALGTMSMSFHISGLCDSPLIGAGHAGDPGNPNCKYCHSGPPVNSGVALLQIQIGDGSNTYQPDSTYDVTVSIAQPNLTKAGFEIIALDSSLANGGILELTDTPRTRLTFDVAKRYLTSTPCGADANVTGINTWSFKWHAPPTPIDTVTFYLASLAANHNDAVTGDTTYTQIIKVTPKLLTGISKVDPYSEISIGPNPSNNELNIFTVNDISGSALFKIIDIDGRIVLQTKADNHHTVTINTSSFSAGIYFLQTELKGRIIKKKFVVSH